MAQVSISDVVEVNDRWFWNETVHGETRRYHTNNRHEGVFELNGLGTKSRQIVGCSEFCLGNKSLAAVKSFLRRHANRQYA